MSDSEPTNTSDGNNESEPPSTITEALLYLCKSDELSIATLKETINNPGLSPVYNGRYDYKHDPDKTLFVFHHACENKNVTLEIIKFLLDNSIKCFPNAPQTLGIGFASWQGDEDNSALEAYPLHIACGNDYCPGDVIRFLVDRYPPALKHVSNINEGVNYNDAYDAGLPLHYYLSRNKNVDIDTVKLLVETYPQSILIPGDEENDEICYPIHALLLNEWTNNIHEILTYMHEHNPASHHVLNASSGTPLHVACQSQGVNLAIIENLCNAWPEAIRMIDNAGYLPLHDLCRNKKIDETDSLEILQFMLDADPTLPRVTTGEGYLPIHLAVDGMSTAFCKALIKAYPESARMRTDDGRLPIHEACCYGDSDTVQYLLEIYPESINTQNNEGWSPIHLAAQFGRAKTIELLLKYDPDAASKTAQNPMEEGRLLPLYLASFSSSGNLETIKVLYDAYPEAIHVRAEGTTPLSVAIMMRKQEVVNFLHTQDVYARNAQDLTTMTTPDANGWLPLHQALRDNAPLGSIKLLVEGNLSALRTADSRMAFPLHLASEFSSVKVVRYLIEEHDGIPMGQLDANKDSILHYACRAANFDVIKYLIESHPSLVALAEGNEKDELPIHLLCEAGEIREDSDDSTLYIETVWLMLLADPEALMS